MDRLRHLNLAAFAVSTLHQISHVAGESRLQLTQTPLEDLCPLKA